MLSRWSMSNKDLKINSFYGDLDFLDGDLSLTNSNIEILKDVVTERLKTNFNDFILNPTYGANLDGYLGKGIDNALIKELKFSIKRCLTFDGFISSDNLDVLEIELENSLKILLYVSANEGDIMIETNYDYEQGSFTVEP